MEIEVTVQSQKEFDEAIGRYVASGYELESNIGDTAVLRKKGFKLWIFIVLVVFFLIGAILYYFLSDDNVVILKKVDGSRRHCAECGCPLNECGEFCPKCGAAIKSDGNSASMINDNAINI